MSFRTVYDFTTGQSTQVELTPEEIAADEANAAAQGPLVRIATARQFKFALWKKGFITLSEISSPELPAIATAALNSTNADNDTRAAAISTWASMTVIPENEPLLELMRLAAGKTAQDKTEVFDIALALT